MAAIDQLDALLQFKPFYDINTTKRMLDAYAQKPHLYKPQSVSQLKDHASHYKLNFPEPPPSTPKDSSFNMLRGIKSMGEGFFSGFSTFQVGEPTNNPYERIMRSVGELAGFVGYVPTLPGKILRSKALVDAARALKGNSVPMFIAKQATNRVRPIVAGTLGKAATLKNSAMKDAAAFLTTGQKIGHVAEGAFHLGVASAVSSWQQGIHGMLDGALHGAVTGGVFRGVANLINKGGIPKIDKLTGKTVLNASQKEDRILRMGAMSLYEGLRSTARGETTPEQIYSYLLGAYFGAHETTAGQAMAMKHVAKTEKQAVQNAKVLKRLDEKGKPYDWDTTVFDPRLTPGWEKLPKDVQESALQHILARHGTYGSQTSMAAETLDKAGLEKLLDTDIVIKESTDSVREQKISDASKKLNTRIENVAVMTPRLLAQHKDKVFLVDDTASAGLKNRENSVVIPTKLDDANIGVNRKIIGDLIKNIPKDKKIVVLKKGVGNALQKEAPQTWDYLQRQIWKATDVKERAEASLEKENKIEKIESDKFEKGDVILKKKSTYFVEQFLDKVVTPEMSPEKAGLAKQDAENKMYDILEKHYTKYDGETINDKAFIEDMQKSFPEQPAFSNEARGELRQILIRRNMQRQVPFATMVFETSKDHDNIGDVKGKFHLIPEDSPMTVGGNSLLQGDSIKSIERVHSQLMNEQGKQVTDRAYLVLEKITVKDGERFNDIEIKDLERRSNFKGKNGSSNVKAKAAADRLIQQAIYGAEQQGYYYGGGKGTTGRMYFYKEHPDFFSPELQRAHMKDLADVKKMFDSNPKKSAQIYNKLSGAWENKWKKDTEAKLSKSYFDRAFISNLLYERDIGGLRGAYPTLKEYAKFLTARNKAGELINTQIADAKGFNKRNQIFLTDGFDLDGTKMNQIYKGGFKDNKANFRLFEDIDKKNLTAQDKAELYKESTDGSILAEEGFVDALNESFGMPKSGQNKSFIVSPNETQGVLLGKFMFHKASPKASEYMRENNLHFLIPRSAAKEFGAREIGKISIDKNDQVNWKYERPKISGPMSAEDMAKFGEYTLDLKDIKGSLSEKQTTHMLHPQLIPKQLMGNLTPNAKSSINQKHIDSFFEDHIGANYRGDPVWNERLEASMEMKTLSEAEQHELVTNIQNYGLTQLTHALKNTSQPALVSKLYQQIVHRNMEDLTSEFNAGQVDQVEYLDALAKAKNFTSATDRLMKIYPDISVYLHKDIRAYVETAKRNYIVNQVTKPKYKYSVAARMRGLDPWLAREKGMSDLNLGVKDTMMLNGKEVTASKYLKETYGVKNADELFFLDNEYKNVEYDVSHLLTGKKSLTLGKLFEEYNSTPAKRMAYPEVTEFFKSLTLRVPMDSISGAHKLTFAGFTGIEGHGAVFHPRTMKALGGADLDGDKATILFGLKKEHKNMYHKNKGEFKDSKTQLISDNKTAIISPAGQKILTETLKAKGHDIQVLNKLREGKATYQDLLTITNDDIKTSGISPQDLKTSLIGRFDPFSRLQTASDARKGYDQLGPTVITKQIMSAAHGALIHNPIQRYVNKDGKTITNEQYRGLTPKGKKLWKGDNREALSVGKGKTIFITPRTSPEELGYQRELGRAQVAFTADSLDEIGLTGRDHYFDASWHAHFKVDWNGNEKLAGKFSPNSDARAGTYQMFKDFDGAYFSRNWDANRRYYAHEIRMMTESVLGLGEKQQGSMLAKMVKVLEPIDYTDSLLARTTHDSLKDRYERYEKFDQKAIEDLNASFPGAGGLLGRTSFASPYHPTIGYAIRENLFDVRTRANLIQNERLYNKFFEKYPDFRNNKIITPTFWKYSFPESRKDQFKSDYSYLLAIRNSEKYRADKVAKVFKLADDFLQNDAMDRVSARQVLKGVDDAVNTGTSLEFVQIMATHANSIKKLERAERKRIVQNMLLESQKKIITDKDNKKKLITVLELDKDINVFKLQQDINQRIRLFKTENATKLKQGGNGKLSKEESYLYDTFMLSTLHRGRDLTKLDAFKEMTPELQEIMLPLVKEIRKAGSSTYFDKTGLNSEYTSDAAIRDFFKENALEYDPIDGKKVKDFDINKEMEPKPGEAESKEKAKPDIWEDELAGIRAARERALKSTHKLDNIERQMVDELVGHLNYYHNSMGTPRNLNLLARGLVNKNFDAMTLADYRVMNRFFGDMRSGNIFIKKGKLTSDNIVILAKRHHMLFPRQVSEELMVKDFKLFESEGRFQNFQGDWVRGVSGMPTQVIESIQWALGESQASATKMDEDVRNEFHQKLLEQTGYESLPGSLGADFFEVATAERDLRAFRNSRHADLSKSDYKHRIEGLEGNLIEAQERANWAQTETERFPVKAKLVETRNGREIVDSINDVLTTQSKKMMRIILGKHYRWSERAQEYVRDTSAENPLEGFIKTNEKGVKQYWDTDGDLPKINAKRFQRYIMNKIKEGKPMDIELGLDNLRLIVRSSNIEQLVHKRSLERDPEIIKGYDKLIYNLTRQKITKTGSFHPNDYHPHFIENKTKAKEAIYNAIKEVKKDLNNNGEAWVISKTKQLINQYRSLTGDWITGDIVEDNIIQGALKEIAEKRHGEHMTHLDKEHIAPNMMSRTTHTPGWTRDVGAWDMYHKNIVDSYFRQIGQIASKKMLQDFSKDTAATWKDPKQALAWENYISDYISRSLGYPSKIPKEWLEGPVGDLMKIKGTPYAWFADNRVKDRVNKIRKALGFKEDERFPEELRGVDEMDIRHWSNLEARYEMATLLAHPKSSAANIFGGTLHTIQSVGWRNWRNARSVNYLSTHLGNEATKMTKRDDWNKFAIKYGVVPDFVRNELALNPNFKSGKWRNFGEDAKRLLEKDPSVKDETLITLAKKHKITESAFNKAAWFMREPERALRRDAFLAHYLQAMELYGHSNMELGHPMLIRMAKKGVQATQFLYSAPYRPAFSATALGKVMTRFQTWAWNSVRFRNDTFKAAKRYGFQEGTPEFDRFKRQYLTDMFVFALGNVFAYSLFESAMPAPYNWFQDTADWIFGDEKERDRAFFGQWPSSIAPLQMITPPGMRLFPATISAIANNDASRLSGYYMWTMFPFGRMARDAKGIMENPMRTVEKTTGLPYQAFAREATKHREGIIKPLGKRESKKLGKEYGWVNRALTNPIRTSDNESVKTAVEQHPEHGWIVFPTIRLEDGALKKHRLKKAMQIAIDNKDFIPVDSLEEGNRISKGFSERLSLNETENKEL